MDYADIKSRMEGLRRELAEITKQNQRYLAKKNHSQEEQEQHRLLQDRVRLVRVELRAFIERTKRHNLMVHRRCSLS